MAIEYESYVVVQKNRRLDEIVFEQYGNVDLLEEVLELNAATIGDALHLPQGTELRLPILLEVEKKVKEMKASTLW